MKSRSKTNVGDAAMDAVERVNDAQDRIVREILQPHATTFVYWSCAAVYLYIGLQKVSPHRSAADVQLATVGGLVGIPYLPFVVCIGVWQILIGGLFLTRRLRVCALFFFTYQMFSLVTLVVLRHRVFQPPWIEALGADVPWALGAYAAFILKNVVFAAVFFVLASVEVDTGGSARPIGGER